VPQVHCDDDDEAIACRAGGSFDPTSLGVVGAWLRNTTVGAVESVTDVLNDNPAANADPARQPVGNADGSMTLVNDLLIWPIGAAQNASPQFGIALWIKPANVTGSKAILAQRMAASGASAMRLLFQLTGAGLLADIYIDDSNARRGRELVSQAAGVPAFVTLEYDGEQSGDARLIITSELNALELTYSASLGVATEMPPTLVQPTGNNFLFATTTTSGSAFVGDAASNIFLLGSKMPGAEIGLLTHEARAALRNFHPLT
jgi:hypothetical protein